MFVDMPWFDTVKHGCNISRGLPSVPVSPMLSHRGQLLVCSLNDTSRCLFFCLLRGRRNIYAFYRRCIFKSCCLIGMLWISVPLQNATQKFLKMKRTNKTVRDWDRTAGLGTTQIPLGVVVFSLPEIVERREISPMKDENLKDKKCSFDKTCFTCSPVALF